MLTVACLCWLCAGLLACLLAVLAVVLCGARTSLLLAFVLCCGVIPLHGLLVLPVGDCVACGGDCAAMACCCAVRCGKACTCLHLLAHVCTVRLFKRAMCRTVSNRAVLRPLKHSFSPLLGLFHPCFAACFAACLAVLWQLLGNFHVQYWGEIEKRFVSMDCAGFAGFKGVLKCAVCGVFCGDLWRCTAHVLHVFKRWDIAGLQMALKLAVVVGCAIWVQYVRENFSADVRY